MASTLKNLSKYDPNIIPHAADMSFGIVVSEWNAHITAALLDACHETLVKHGASPEKIFVSQVPGSYELPLGARILNGHHNPDAVICLGCVIKGETRHDEYINTAVANGIMQLGLMSAKPFVFGLLTVENEQQALDRAGGQHGNKGTECAVTAIRMVALKNAGPTGAGKRKIGF